jgi:hypothetical protein
MPRFESGTLEWMKDALPNSAPLSLDILFSLLFLLNLNAPYFVILFIFLTISKTYLSGKVQSHEEQIQRFENALVPQINFKSIKLDPIIINTICTTQHMCNQ